MDRVSQKRSLQSIREVFNIETSPAKPAVEARAFDAVQNESVRSILDDLLLAPTMELKSRPSHQFRSHLVRLGAELSVLPYDELANDEELSLCAEAIEFLHLGSLIVDDIQDGSAVRRRGPALHAKLGVPHALSVGNWLYFRAIRTLEKLDLSPARRQLLNDEWHEAMELAHYGQVMDLSLSVEQLPLAKLIDVCYHCALYKTGSIAALAIGMGAVIQGASHERIQDIKKLGSALGVYLQQLNDIGNLLGDFDSEKRFEDLISLKPSFVWSLTLEKFGPSSLDQLFQATRILPLDDKLQEWIARHSLLEVAETHAENTFQRAISEFQDAYPASDLSQLKELKNRIKSAYA
jgi:geranylgeranyl pyrophosphate synthase